MRCGVSHHKCFRSYGFPKDGYLLVPLIWNFLNPFISNGGSVGAITAPVSWFVAHSSVLYRFEEWVAPTVVVKSVCVACKQKEVNHLSYVVKVRELWFHTILLWSLMFSLYMTKNTLYLPWCLWLERIWSFWLTICPSNYWMSINRSWVTLLCLILLWWIATTTKFAQSVWKQAAWIWWNKCARGLSNWPL